jgi:hypothetical protein
MQNRATADTTRGGMGGVDARLTAPECGRITRKRVLSLRRSGFFNNNNGPYYVFSARSKAAAKRINKRIREIDPSASFVGQRDTRLD